MALPTVPDLAALHERRSEKWDGHDPDVVVSTIAEMDFPVAAPIAEVLHAAIDRRGLDYGRPGAGHVRLNFATSPELLAETVRRMAVSTQAESRGF